MPPDSLLPSLMEAIQQEERKHHNRRTRLYEIRYATENFSNALWGTYRDYDQAVLAKRDFLSLLASSTMAGVNQIIKSVDIV